ncbi:acyloxyacyl hydrolase [Aerophototrophica crusticola]|uniref:Acyloxyacyl hydrolase n=1 Tax=Aerophototrophica crusticola TaxID=1709002 RepID=A0A858R885_9PROT|nr:acyloxyacyl hydrolase [Rhodospirillaceae bacterium B3]
MRIPRMAALAALLLAIPGMAGAGELRLGLLRQDFTSFWAAGRNFERAWALNAEWAADPLGRVIGGELIPFAGGTWAPGKELDRLHAGLNWQLSADRAFLRLGLGVAVHNGKTNDPDSYGRRRQMGSRFLFHVPVEVGFRLDQRLSLSAYFDHVSNANLDDINPGIDTAGLRVGLRF